ncbi:solute carrier family 2, facilitated glucose transporter member 10 [Callorhinchus milii]|uniref:Solute carrier family 2, facilitated glucose transporter member 10 n=1 Tax=Callorhinchus milii TaxID=7868 RepID=A0A4W3J2R5_CALMI|nr:solute carrier family 2, facilitated glucose transporter member 10 [Callorhinchus milii]XP_042197755.1 solute carrier family 2, facilitated glucose transporter member 10 [Callorhinchus milii]XP_042197756.1 solute carrier family 2, facilitated glucose transporter member 10 [Callorhinchus milii]|eukprot:gi/632973858/ref/XP_007903358.1/ PREDICTED: solute carrier family 2, facilitated glucose transporter member 10 [Callorhinchus milii]
MGKTASVLFLCSTVALLGGLIFGYELGIISGALLQLQQSFALSCWQQEVLVSALLIGAFLASLVAGPVIDYHGKKKAMLLGTILTCGGSVILSLASAFTVLVTGRLVIGFAMSVSSTACCIYVSEMVRPHQRGMLVSLYEVGITVGILSAYALNYVWSDVGSGWKYMFGLAIGPAALQGFSLIFLPSSPRCVTTGDDESQKVLLQLYSTDRDHLDSQDVHSAERIEDQYSFLDLFGSKDNMRTRMVVALVLVMSQQLTGQPNVLYYASIIFRSVGFHSNHSAVLASVGLGIVKVLATLVAMVCADKVGRRTLLMSGCTVMSVSVTVIAFLNQNLTVELHKTCRVETQVNGSFHTLNSSLTSDSVVWKSNSWFTNNSQVNTMSSVPDNPHFTFDDRFSSNRSLQVVDVVDSWLPTSEETFHMKNPKSHIRRNAIGSTRFSKHLALNWIMLLSMMAFVSGYSIGFGPMTWLVLSEIFPAGIRGRAFSFSSSFNWATNILVTLTFLDTIDTVGLSGTFLFYGLVGFASVVFIYLFLPETKGESLEQIDKHFSGARVSEIKCCCRIPDRRGASGDRYQRVEVSSL